MAGKKMMAYIGLCFCAIVIGLTPSVILNVKPYWEHDKGMAVVQLAFVIAAAIIPLALKKNLESFLVILFLLGVFYVSVGNGVESITLARSGFTSEREGKKDAKEDWNTRIEEWVAEKRTLASKYTPTTEESLKSAQEGVENANKARDAACKYVTKTCDAAIQDAKAAQKNLDQVSHDFGLTQRVVKLEGDIERARSELRKIGSTPVDHLAKAKEANSSFLNHRESSMAIVGEVMAAIGPRSLIAAIGLLFAEIFGKNWRNPPSIESTPRESPIAKAWAETEEPRQLISPIPTDSSQAPPRKSPSPASRMVYVEGVQAWLNVVRPSPGRGTGWYATGEVFDDYVAFCKSKGYPPCKAPTSLGTIIKNDCPPMPFKRKGGRTYYEFNLPPKLTLVKSEPEAIAS